MKSLTLLSKEISKNIEYERKKKGLSFFNAGLGQSPMPVPESFKEELVKHLDVKEYTSTSGYKPLKAKMGNHLVIGNGLKPLIFILQMAFSHLYPDGYIIHVLPAWVSYMEQTNIIKAKQIGIYCDEEDNWKLTPTKLEEALKVTNKKPTLIIINNPTNPTGQIYTQKELNNIGGVLKKYNTFIFYDAIYENLVHTSFKSKMGNLRESVNEIIVGSSLSKDMGCGGYRFGWLQFINKKIENKLNQTQDLYNYCTDLASSIYSCPSPMFQYLAIKALDKEEDIKKFINFQQNMFENIGKTIINNLKDTKLKITTPQACWYLWLDFSNYKNAFEKIKITNNLELTNHLTKEIGMVSIPGKAFGCYKLSLRMSYVDIKDIDYIKNKYNAENIYNGIKRLKQFLKDLDQI